MKTSIEAKTPVRDDEEKKSRVRRYLAMRKGGYSGTLASKRVGSNVTHLKLWAVKFGIEWTA